MLSSEESVLLMYTTQLHCIACGILAYNLLITSLALYQLGYMLSYLGDEILMFIVYVWR